MLGLGKSLAPLVVDGRFLLPGVPAASVLALAAEDEGEDNEEEEDDSEDARELIEFNDIAHLLVDREEEGGEEEEQEEQEQHEEVDE